jgi:hypothetical protein
MTGQHSRYLTPRARRRRLIEKIVKTIIYVLFALVIILGTMALLGCAAETAAELIKM